MEGNRLLTLGPLYQNYLFGNDNKRIFTVVYTVTYQLYININMNVVYYFKVYTELRYVIAKLLPYIKDCTRWRFNGVLIYKMTL